MPDAMLLNYVRNQLNAGFTPEEIREALINYGYPIRDIDDVIDSIVRPKVQKPKQVPIQTVPAEKTAVYIDIFSILKSWFFSLITPDTVFKEQKKNVSLSNGFMNMLIAAALSALLLGFAGMAKSFISQGGVAGSTATFLGKLGSVSILSGIITISMASVFLWLGLSALFYVFAVLFGGKGTFETQSYLMSFYMAPLVLIASILSLVPMPCVLLFVYLILGGFSLFPLTYAIKEAHDFDSVLISVFVWLIPLVLMIIASLHILKVAPATIKLVCLASPAA